MDPQTALENVNNAITECMDKDEQPWDYYEQLQSSQNGKYYYDSNRLVKFNEISIPKAISDSLNHQNEANGLNYFGGFFESINRAYFVMNSSIYLWDYLNKNRWCCLNQFNDQITALCLVKSRKNIFIDKIQYLLIVATRIEIIIIGIGFTNNLINGELEAFPTKYKISTDNVIVNKIISDSTTRRIFLCCNGGNVYEFEYFYKQNLFGQHIRKCIKTNISDSFASKLFKSLSFPPNNNLNNCNDHFAMQKQGVIDIMIHDDIFYAKCLFSLSSDGVINGYKFDDNGNENADEDSVKYPITKILSYHRLSKDIQLQIQQMTDDNQAYFYHSNTPNIKIVKICKVDKYESQQCQLMGISSEGDRLFFAISQSSNSWNMELSFIRIRPPFLNYHKNASMHMNINNNVFEPSIQPSSSPQNVSTCFHQNGVTLMNSLKSNNADCLLMIYRNNVETVKSKFSRTQLIESIESDIANSNNSILSICEMPLQTYVSAQSFMLFSRKEMRKMNSGQPFIGLSQFAIQHLLPSTIYLCLRQKTITFYKMQRYIDQFKVLLKAKNYQNILRFIDKIGLIECEVMCLLIMIRYDADYDDKKQHFKEDEDLIAAEALKLFMTEINGQQIYLYQDIMQRLCCQKTKDLSMYLCLSRILRPIWSSTICILDIKNNNNISARYSCDELYRMINPLSKFKKVLLNINGNNHLSVWVSACIQILSILIMLTRCHFNSIYDELSVERQSLLKHICFEQLITKQRGTDLLKNIISLMITKLSDDEIKKLHSECPTYFTSAQLITFMAKSKLNDRSTLQSALKMFCDVCDDESFDLNNVCKLLRNAKYYHGVIQLVFCLQNKLIFKINEVGKQRQQIRQLQQVQIQQQHIQQNIMQRDQIQKFENSINRLNNRIVNAWNQIFECLRILYLENTNGSGSFLDESRARVLKLCLMETNKDFCFKLYEWFLENKIVHILFKHKPRYLEEYLGQNKDDDMTQGNVSSNERPERNNRLIKLVYYYKEIGQIGKMIQLLDALTKSQGFELSERNNFLIEAKRATKSLNANRSGFDPHNVVTDKYNKFEEKSILCQIQLNVLNELIKAKNNNCLPVASDQDLFELNDKLLNLERIYVISKKYHLFEYALDCLSFANDPDAAEHIHGCWLLHIADVIKKYKNEWTQYLEHNMSKLVNKYNLQQQPWMFDHFRILLYLNKTNIQTHQEPSNSVIVDTIFPIIEQKEVIMDYKQILNEIEAQYKLNIVHSIHYLLTKKISEKGTKLNQNNNDSNMFNPRLLTANNTLLNTSRAIISSTSNIQDLITHSIQCLEKQNNHSNDPQILRLIKDFQSLNQNFV